MRKDIKIGSYRVCLLYDEDKHLNVFVSNEDNTEVIDCGSIHGEDIEFSVRLSTKQIEENYKQLSLNGE